MKRTNFLSLLAAATLAALLISCRDDSSLPVSPAADLPSKGGSKGGTTLMPEIAYVDDAGGRNSSVQVIKVMASDGSHKTIIYAASKGSVLMGGPSWASSGTGTQSSPWSLAFVEQPSAGTFLLKAVDIYASSSGVSTVTNARTVTTISDDRVIGGVAWRPGSDEIALASHKQVGDDWRGGDAEVFVTNLSGTLTRIYPTSGEPSPTLSTAYVTWSPTGDTVAFDLHENGGNDGDTYNDVSTIVMMKRDGTMLGRYGYEDSVKRFTGISGLDWSSDGRLAVSAVLDLARYDSSGNFISGMMGPNVLYTLDPATGIITKCFQSKQPSWSPDASSLVYKGPFDLEHFVETGLFVGPPGKTIGTSISTTGRYPAWRRTRS